MSKCISVKYIKRIINLFHLAQVSMDTFFSVVEKRKETTKQTARRLIKIFKSEN